MYVNSLALIDSRSFVSHIVNRLVAVLLFSSLQLCVFLQEPIWNRGPTGPWPWPWPWTAVSGERRGGVAGALTSSVPSAEPPSLQSGEEVAGAVTSSVPSARPPSLQCDEDKAGALTSSVTGTGPPSLQSGEEEAGTLTSSVPSAGPPSLQCGEEE